MLQQIRMPRNMGGLAQLSVDPEIMGSGQQVRIDTGRLNAARYIVIFLGAAMLLSLVVQALWLGGDVTLSRVIKVGLVAILGPSLFWAASGKELSLLGELQKRTSQLEQRVRENKALNRMTQAHLAECLSLAQPQQPDPNVDHGRADDFSNWPEVYVGPDTHSVLVSSPEGVKLVHRQPEAITATMSTFTTG